MAALRSAAVGTWTPAGDQFFARELLHDMDWRDMADLGSKRLAIAPCGGPIAAVRDESKLVALGPGGGAGRLVVRLFSASGGELGSVLWERGRLALLGWTPRMQLLLMDDTGKAALYSPLGAKEREFSLGGEVLAQGVARACLAGDALVVATQAGALWAVPRLAEPRPVKLADVPLPGPPACLAAIDPQLSPSGGLEVLVPGPGGVLWQVDRVSAQDQAVAPGGAEVLRLVVSPNAQFVALFTSDGQLVVMSADLSRRISEFDTKATVPPAQLVWCGADALAAHWPGILLLVAPYGNWLQQAADEPLALLAEVDGLRVISSSSHELVRKVPEVAEQVYRPGSTSPAAQLWEARGLFEARSARADKVLRDMRGSLADAVKTCTRAAALELDVPRQRALLRAAVFGAAFCPDLPPRLLHDTCTTLRVLNAVRDPSVGLAPSWEQLEALGMEGLVARLVALRQHLLAYRIAQATSAGPEGVLLSWACAKISADAGAAPDTQLRDQLVARLKACPGVRYAQLAAHAQACGRRSLALKLLEEEASAAAQVPLLLSLAAGQPASSAASDDGSSSGGSEDPLGRALRKAVEAGDPDLVHLVLFAAYRQRPLADFWHVTSGRALARNLWAKYAAAKEPELLESLYAGSAAASAELGELQIRRAVAALAEACRPAAPGASRPDEARVSKAVAALGEVAGKYTQHKELGPSARAAQELAALRREQLALERDSGQALFLGLPLAATLAQCLRLGHAKAAAQLRRSFGVSEQRWWWLRLRGACEARDWEALEGLAAEKRAPVAGGGWEPLLEAARRAGAPREVVGRLISRMPDSQRKAEAFSAIDHAREAAEVAARLRDGDLFSRIQAAVSAGSPAGLAIAQLKDKVQAGFK